MAGFFICNFFVLAFGLSYSIVTNATVLIFFVCLLSAFWFISYVFNYSRLFGPLTTTNNTNLGYEDTRDFMYSMGWYSRSHAAANRAVGLIELYKFGIRGFISLSWPRISSIEKVTTTDVILYKNVWFSYIEKILKTDTVVLRFQSAADADQFLAVAAPLLKTVNSFRE